MTDQEKKDCNYDPDKLSKTDNKPFCQFIWIIIAIFLLLLGHDFMLQSTLAYVQNIQSYNLIFY